MAKANQKAKHPLPVFNKIQLITTKQLKKINKSIKKRKRKDKHNINKYRFRKKGKKGRDW